MSYLSQQKGSPDLLPSLKMYVFIYRAAQIIKIFKKSQYSQVFLMKANFLRYKKTRLFGPDLNKYNSDFIFTILCSPIICTDQDYMTAYLKTVREPQKKTSWRQNTEDTPRTAISLFWVQTTVDQRNISTHQDMTETVLLTLTFNRTRSKLKLA